MDHNSPLNGFTLIELLITITIISILSAIAIPSFLNQVERAREVKVIILLDSLSNDVEQYRIEENRYPPDVNADINPGLDEWPSTVPFNSVVDYEHWGIGSNKCAVLLTHFGKNNRRDSTTHIGYGSTGSIVKNGDDFIKTIAEYECDRPQGTIR